MWHEEMVSFFDWHGLARIYFTPPLVEAERLSKKISPNFEETPARSSSHALSSRISFP